MKQRWKKRQEPASHIDDWLMTYADLITLLLCFFALFVTVSIPQKNAQKAHITKTIEEPPLPPNDMLQGNLPFYGHVQVDRNADEFADTDKEKDLKTPAVNTATASVVQISDTSVNKPSELPPVVARTPTVPDLPTPAKKDATPAAPTEADAALSKIVDHLKTQGPADLEQKGDRLTTIEVNSAAFFDRGSATLSEAGKAVLRDVARTIKSNRYEDYQVTVEGHTDDAPIKTPQFPSNWELSTARAAAVVHFFLDQGISAQRLRASGYADTFPKVPNRNAAGDPIPANQAQNRRVVIKLEKIDKTN